MNFFKKLFGGKSENKDRHKLETQSKEIPNKRSKPTSDLKRIFLAGWEVKLNGDQQCQDFIHTQVTSEYNAKSIDSGIELIFENDQLKSVFDFKKGVGNPRGLAVDEIGLEYLDLEPHPILIFSDNPIGHHQLGGDKPENCKFPPNDCVVPFQYLGYISKEDSNFNWLPGTIHLMCPIFLNIDKVFLDYSNPLQPILLNREEVEGMDTSYGDLNKDSSIIYNSRKFDLIPFDDFELPMHAGLPNWIQYPTFPKCPKSGKRMKFLCQINEGVTTRFTNVEPEKEFFRRYFEKLNFWGDGDLFVFIEPEEKTVCYFIQNT